MIGNIRNTAGDHFVVGDFNLHHPLWGGKATERINVGVRLLVEAVESGTLVLLNTRGVPTRENKTTDH